MNIFSIKGWSRFKLDASILKLQEPLQQKPKQKNQANGQIP